ncbi:MAG: septum formation protein Maf [Spirochaetes bacterium]|nr:septum formation protein Maf [Spirochaetota bacterium]MBU0956142.1 septum formation protein Maf [Spirochaetota bacterium]
MSVRLALASASPRRLELLRGIGLQVAAFPVDMDESVFDHLPVVRRTRELALAKVQAALPGIPEDWRWVLGADTLIELPHWRGGKALGKAADADEARTMLQALSGRRHLVHSGLALLDRSSGRHWQTQGSTRVHFARLSDSEIESYLTCGEWQGVAGAYRIQERAACFIRCIKGTYSGVMGLPIHEFYVMVRRSGLNLYGEEPGSL